MSFGYSVGDFFTVVQFAYKVWEHCKASQSTFRDIGRDVGNAHITLKTIHRFWTAEEDRGRTLLEPQQEELKEYTESCKSSLEKLEDIMQKYGGMETSVRKKLKFVWKDLIDNFASIREQLQRSTGNLAIFHTNLTQEALMRRFDDEPINPLKEQQMAANIMEYLIRTYVEFQRGERQEPAYSQLSRTPGQEKHEIYAATEGELEQQDGIDKAGVISHQTLIRDWLDTVILAETADGAEDDDDSDTAVEGPRNVPVRPGRFPTSAEMERMLRERKLKNTARGTGRSLGDLKNSEKMLFSRTDTQLAADNADGQSENPVVSEPPPGYRNRSDSVDTHRSQASTWDPPTGHSIDPHAMLAKVLMSNYARSEGDTPFHLPIKRAFRALDVSKRGWLTSGIVEEACLGATNLAKWSFEKSRAVAIIRNEDSREGKPDNRINVDELKSIILTTRNEILQNHCNYSASMSLPFAGRALKAWIDEDTDLSMLSGRWRKTGPNQWLHKIGGALPEGLVPLSLNFTNAIYLAVRYSISILQAALRDWQPYIQSLGDNAERDEYVKALDQVTEAALDFHDLEDNQGFNYYHSADKFIDDASLLPLHLFRDVEELRDCPFHDIVQMRGNFLEELKLILGFVFDVDPNNTQTGFSRSQSVPVITIRDWRRLRMADRAEFVKSASSISSLRDSLHEKLQWYKDPKHEHILNSWVTKCLNATSELRKAQAEETKAALEAKERPEMSRVVLSGLRRNILLRKPTVYLKVYVDGEMIYYQSQKSTIPMFSLGRAELTPSSAISFEFGLVHDKSLEKLGSLSVIAKDVIDFNRRADVHLKRQLEGASDTLQVEITFSLPQSWSQKRMDHDNLEQKEKWCQTLSDPKYIQSHPVPAGWECWRAADRDGKLDKLVYFSKPDTQDCTAVLWTSGLDDGNPHPPTVALPQMWTCFAEGGRIQYEKLERIGGQYVSCVYGALQEQSSESITMPILSPVRFSNHRVFYSAAEKELAVKRYPGIERVEM